MWKILVPLSLVFTASTSSAYNWEECKKIYRPESVRSGGDPKTFTIQISTNTTAQSSSSTTSYVSSTGKCSALAPKESDQSKAFFFENYEEIKAEAAMGQGEYLVSFVSLMGCNKMESTQLIRSIQSHYSLVYAENSIPTAYGKLENLTLTHCQPLHW